MRYVAAIVVCSLFAPSAFAANEVIELIPKDAFCVLQIDGKALRDIPLVKKLGAEKYWKTSFYLAKQLSPLYGSESFNDIYHLYMNGVMKICEELQVNRVTIVLVDQPTAFLRFELLLFIEGDNKQDDYANLFKKYTTANANTKVSTETIGKHTISTATLVSRGFGGVNRTTRRDDVLLKPSLYVISYDVGSLKQIIEKFAIRAGTDKKPGIAGGIGDTIAKVPEDLPFVAMIKKTKIADSPMWLAYHTVSHSIAVAATVGNDLGLRVECLSTDSSEAATIKMVDDYLANNAKQPKPQPLYAAAKITKNKPDKLNATYIAIIPAKTIIDHYKE